MTLIAAAVVGLGSWGMGVRPSRLLTSAPPPLESLEVDRGDVALVVVENGSLESANNATVRCQVEALLGMTGGALAGGQGGQVGTQAGATTTGGATTTTTQSTATASPQPTTATPSSSQAKTKSASSRTTTASGSAATTSTSASSSATASQASGATAGATTSGGAATTNTKPVIRSFTYEVVPYVPLRPKTTTPVKAAPKQVQPVDPAAGGGGGGRGGRGGQNAATAVAEKPGSTRILWILPEGTQVKAGDVVCELDSAAFRDELQAQEIRTTQARAYVEQAQASLEVSEISLNEYRDGIYPQDAQLIRQYITTCRIEHERAQHNLEWSQQVAQKHLRTPAQLRADILSLQRAENDLREAEGMDYRLEHYTAPKIIKSLEAKIEAIRADKLNQESAYQLENQRFERLKRMVANCTLRAPRDGIVVYSNQANNRGQAEVLIQEGATVREGQPIFDLPDPRHMRVNARINESKLALIQPGQRAVIRIDAFPNQPLTGRVTEITAIPAPANRASPDIKVYFAKVTIDTGGFEGLRPGLSAEVAFQVEARSQVTRVPLQTIRWVGDQAYAAVLAPSSSAWQWRRVDLGLTDPAYAEVIAGLKPGERVAAEPERLPAPSVAGTSTVAGATTQPRG